MNASTRNYTPAHHSLLFLKAEHDKEYKQFHVYTTTTLLVCVPTLAEVSDEASICLPNDTTNAP
jgi:hypothetical protein